MKKTFSAIVLSAFLVASALLLLCPSMMSAGTMQHHCGEVVGISSFAGAMLSATPADCMQAHIATFRSLIFVMPDVFQILFSTLIILAAIFVAFGQARRQQLPEQILSRLKLYCKNFRLHNHTKKLLSWLATLELRDFASC